MTARQTEVPAAHWLAVAGFLLAFQIGCRQAPLRVCAEQLCFELPAEIQQRQGDRKHRFSLSDQSGWLAVQSFDPDAAIPTDAEPRMSVVRQRFLDEGWAEITTTTATVASQQAIRVDAVLATHTPPLRRRMWLIPRAGSWVAVDITGPRTDFARALAIWEPIANRATSQSSH